MDHNHDHHLPNGADLHGTSNHGSAGHPGNDDHSAHSGCGGAKGHMMSVSIFFLFLNLPVPVPILDKLCFGGNKYSSLFSHLLNLVWSTHVRLPIERLFSEILKYYFNFFVHCTNYQKIMIFVFFQSYLLDLRHDSTLLRFQTNVYRSESSEVFAPKNFNLTN